LARRLHKVKHALEALGQGGSEGDNGRKQRDELRNLNSRAGKFVFRIGILRFGDVSLPVFMAGGRIEEAARCRSFVFDASLLPRRFVPLDS